MYFSLLFCNERWSQQRGAEGINIYIANIFFRLEKQQGECGKWGFKVELSFKLAEW